MNQRFLAKYQVRFLAKYHVFILVEDRGATAIPMFLEGYQATMNMTTMLIAGSERPDRDRD